VAEESTDGQTAGTDESKADGTAFKPITSQDDLNRLIGDRINKVKSQFADYEDLKAKASKFDEAEQANKSELEKERERAEKAEERATKAEQATLRADVAAAKGLTAGQAKRLVGSTREELEADADEILADFAPKKTTPSSKTLRSGSSGDDTSGLTGKERAAAALRQLRTG